METVNTVDGDYGETTDYDSNDETLDEELWRIERLEREEYFEKLKEWLDEARLCYYYVNPALPFNMTENGIRDNITQEINSIIATLTQTNLLNLYSETLLLQRFVNNVTPTNQANVTPTTQATPNPVTYEFRLPPLWKQALAKFMDFLILFSFKMALTIILMESFETIDMEVNEFDAL